MNKRKLVPEKNGKEYDLNSMSEGEKVTLFYILITLFAPRDAYIIVDEPETFLNPSMYNRLWYLLEEYRKLEDIDNQLNKDFEKINIGLLYDNNSILKNVVVLFDDTIEEFIIDDKNIFEEINFFFRICWF